MGDAYSDCILEHRMTDKKDEAPKPKAKPKRITLEHPNMKGLARVWKKDLDAWLGKGWREVKSAGNAE